ncbi:MAG: restriction endonuclease subunit S [Bordetella sp.]|nr:restriction endonuclease subunit S [Bordetella sp.]
MSAPAYDAYRDSGIDWLGKVPSHWSVSPLKTAYSIFGGATPKSEREDYWDGGVPWVTPADLSRLTSPFIGETLRTISETGLASCAATLIPADSVILSTRAPIGSIGIATAPATTNQGCKALVSRGGAVPSFLAYTLSIATEQLRVRGKGTTFLELSGDELGRFKMPNPPPIEQAAIAAFLDRETGKIDALVEAQTRLIELLKEKRQAVISHAVTKGLDPAAPMKDSGVEWLGQVPAHWEVKRLSYVFRTISSGTTPPSDQAAYYDGEVNWVTTGELRERAILQTAKQVSDGALRTFSALKIYQPGTLLIAMYGATIGRLGWLAAPAATNQACCAFADPVGAETRFVFRYLQAAREFIILLASGGGQPNISQEKLRSLPIPLPPMPEQAAIIDALDGQLQNIERLEGEAEAAVALLRERRAALISAAVTGKIDVRGLAPEQAEAA